MFQGIECFYKLKIGYSKILSPMETNPNAFQDQVILEIFDIKASLSLLA